MALFRSGLEFYTATFGELCQISLYNAIAVSFGATGSCERGWMG